MHIYAGCKLSFFFCMPQVLEQITEDLYNNVLH